MPGANRLKQFAILSLVFLVLVGAVLFYLFNVATDSKPSLLGELKRAEIEVDGIPRTLTYYVPSQRESVPKPALVFILHGSRGSDKDIRKQTGYEFDHIADAGEVKPQDGMPFGC